MANVSQITADLPPAVSCTSKVVGYHLGHFHKNHLLPWIRHLPKNKMYCGHYKRCMWWCFIASGGFRRWIWHTDSNGWWESQQEGQEPDIAIISPCCERGKRASLMPQFFYNRVVWGCNSSTRSTGSFIWCDLRVVYNMYKYARRFLYSTRAANRRCPINIPEGLDGSRFRRSETSHAQDYADTVPLPAALPLRFDHTVWEFCTYCTYENNSTKWTWSPK